MISDSSFSSRNQKSTDNMISETIPENETVNASARKLNTAVNYNIASKDDIYHMSLILLIIMIKFPVLFISLHREI